MTDQQNHPLHGMGLDQMLGELVRHYGWEILAEQININCFKNYPSFDGSAKFLRKTQWAREKLEAFYMYRFKSLPPPTDDQHALAPRERLVLTDWQSLQPTDIELGEGEFFDDPISGPVFPSKKAVEASRSKKEGSPVAKKSRRAKSDSTSSQVNNEISNNDPWAKWRK